MTILCYHTVEDDWDSTLAIPVDDFERHCAWLDANRSVVPLDEARRRLDRRFRPRGRTTALTFDDGWRGVYDNAWPILRRHGLPFTVFVIVDTLSPEPASTDWVDNPPDAPLDFLTLDQVREMHDAGVDIASHSRRHDDLRTLGYEACLEDLRSSRELLSDLLGARVTTLAYPKGHHDATVCRAAADAGYEMAFTLPERAEEPSAMTVPRVGVYPGNDTRALWIKTRRRYLDVRLSRVHELGRRAASVRRPGSSARLVR